MNITEIQSLANDAAGVMVNALWRDGFMLKSPNKVLGEYIIVVHRKGVLGRWFDKLRGTPDTGYTLRVARIPSDGTN